MSQVVGLPNNSYKPYHQYGVGSRLCKLNGRWFSPGTLASSTTKTGRHDIAEVLLKVVLNTKNQNQSQKYYASNVTLTSKDPTNTLIKLLIKCNKPLWSVQSVLDDCCSVPLLQIPQSRKRSFTWYGSYQHGQQNVEDFGNVWVIIRVNQNESNEQG